MQPDERIRRARECNLIRVLQDAGYSPASKVHEDKAMFHSPLREDKHPSFSVRRINGVWVWYDFGTGEHGDVIDFVMRYQGVPFKDAVERLLGESAEPGRAPARQRHDEQQPTRAEKIMDVRKLYREALLRMGPAEEEAIRGYLARCGLPECADLHAVVLRWQGVSYLAVPIPSLTHMRGLECRALEQDTPEAQRRRTFGYKTLWVLKRDPKIMLVTESVFDCLAGDQLFNGRRTLCALNGIANVERLAAAVKALKPQVVELALDNDDDKEKGPAAERKAHELLAAYPVKIAFIRDHHTAGVKDLGALWRLRANASHSKKGQT